MPATAADVAAYTVDGIVVTSQNSAIKTLIHDAKDLGENEIEMFFDDPADAQVMLDEKFAILSTIGPLHEGIEVEDRIGIGTAIPYTPAVPSFTVVDDSRNLNAVGRLRAFVEDRHTDRFSIELLG